VVNEFKADTPIAKILITGANGFVGSHVLQSLMAIQHDDVEIVAACRNPRKLIPAYRGEVRVGDLRDADYLDRLLINIDVVCHTAGWSSFIANQRNSTQLYLEPTLELINRAIEWRVSRFVNVSSLAAAALPQRQDSMARGQPRRYWPMINCLIAVEDYMRSYAQTGCTMVNLRLGIYSGQRINIGLLPVLIKSLATTHLGYTLGSYGYFPLVDGRDIGQAFARAALAPELSQYTSFNITGPDHPSGADVIHFLQRQLPAYKTALAMPALASRVYGWWQEQFKNTRKRLTFTRSLADLMSNPLILNDLSTDKLGYDPTISWQASLLSLVNDTQKHDHSAPLSAPDR
jgi:nucleoside-diphosphate-sugar epimerase